MNARVADEREIKEETDEKKANFIRGFNESQIKDIKNKEDKRNEDVQGKEEKKRNLQGEQKTLQSRRFKVLSVKHSQLSLLGAW